MGRSRGGLTTKIHAIVDALGNPMPAHLAGRAGSRHHTSRSARGSWRARPRRAVLQYNQAFPGHRHALREDRTKLPRRSALGLRARLA